jgi:hypothetical protein
MIFLRFQAACWPPIMALLAANYGTDWPGIATLLAAESGHLHEGFSGT